MLGAKEGVRLVRVPIEGGAEEPIVWKGDLRIPPNWLAPNAVGSDGRIAVRVIAKDSWFWPAAVIDPRTGRVERTPPGFEIDMNSPGWTHDGRVLSIARFLRSGLWRFKPSQPPLE